MQHNFSRFFLTLLVSACLVPGGLRAQDGARPASRKPLPGGPDFPARYVPGQHHAGARPGADASTPPPQNIGVGPGPVIPPTLSTCNLVANPSFDDQLMTPTGSISNVAGPGSFESDVANWECPDLGSTDYYATNAPVNSYVYPNTSLFGPFTPHNNAATGHNACVGLWAYLSDPNLIRENVTQKLTAPLKNGSSYYVSFYAYLSANSEHAGTVTLNLTAADPRVGPNAGNYTPGTFSVTSPVLPDRAWTRVSAIVTIPNGDNPPAPPQYVNIGGMGTTSQPVASNSPGNGFDGAYYYIDDVEIYEIPVAPTPNRIYTCFGANGIFIGAGCSAIPGATYSWSAVRVLDGGAVTGAALPPNPAAVLNKVYPTEPTLYTLKVTLPGNNNVHTTSVYAYPYDWVGLTAQAFSGTGYNNLPNGGSTPVCNGRTVDFYAANQVAAGPYVWTVNGTTMPTSSWYSTYAGPDYNMAMGQNFNRIAITPNASATTARWYTVTVAATGTCTGQPVSQTFSFYYNPTVFCRSAAPGNDPAASTAPVAKTGAYPNPASGSVTVPAGLQRVQLLDGTGHPVLDRAQPGTALDLRALPEGLYQLRTVGPDGKVQTQRLVITR